MSTSEQAKSYFEQTWDIVGQQTKVPTGAWLERLSSSLAQNFLTEAGISKPMESQIDTIKGVFAQLVDITVRGQTVGDSFGGLAEQTKELHKQLTYALVNYGAPVERMIGANTPISQFTDPTTLNQAIDSQSALAEPAPTPSRDSGGPRTLFSAPSTGEPTRKTPVTDQEIRDAAIELYGVGMAHYLNHPEIGKIILDGAKAGDEMPILVGKLTHTDWWQKTSKAAREWDFLKIEDPASAQRAINRQVENFRDIAKTWGIPLKAKQFVRLAEESLRQAWSEDEIRDGLLAYATYENFDRDSDLGATQGRVKETGAAYFNRVSGRESFDFAKRIAKGELTEDGVANHYRQQAKARYSHLKEQIDQGLTLEDIFSGHRQTLAQELELDPDQIDFVNDSRWRDVISNVTQDGKVREMSLGEATVHARKQEDWQYTRGAHAKMSNLAAQIAQTFGEVSF